MNNTTADLPPLSEYRFNMLADAALDVLVECSPKACKVWLVMCKARRWATDRVCYSVSALAKAAGMSRNTLLQSVKELREVGLLRYEAQRNRTTEYEVVGVLPRGARPGEGTAWNRRVREGLAALLPASSGASLPVSPEGQLVQNLNRESAPGVQNLNLIPKELPTKRTEVGSTCSSLTRARETDGQGNELRVDPVAEWRMRRLEQRRVLAEEGTEEVAGRLPVADMTEGLHEEVRRRILAGDSVGEILDGLLRPFGALEAVYSLDDVPGALGDTWAPFAPESAPPARFCASLACGGARVDEETARSVWARVGDAVAVRELTPRVVEAAARYVSESGQITADRLTLEVWTQVKVQRMTMRSAINEATGEPVEEAGTR